MKIVTIGPDNDLPLLGVVAMTMATDRLVGWLIGNGFYE